MVNVFLIRMVNGIVITHIGGFVPLFSDRSHYNCFIFLLNSSGEECDTCDSVTYIDYFKNNYLQQTVFVRFVDNVFLRA